MLAATVSNQIVADMSAKIGLRAQFVAEYLETMGYTALDLSRSVIGAATQTPPAFLAVSEAIFMDRSLPKFAGV
jgi:hypothetical protein